MNPLLQNKPLNLGLTGAQPLSKPTQPIPGSGIFSSVGNLFKAPAKPAVSTPAPSLLSGFGSYSAPGNLGAISANMPGLPSLAPKAPTQPVAAPSAPVVPVAPKANVPVTTQPSQAQLNGLASQIAEIQNSMASFKPKNFGVADSDTFDSSMLTAGTKSDLMEMRKAKEEAMMRGLNPDGTSNLYIPSDTLMGQLTNRLYEASQYRPEEQQALQQYADATKLINSKNLALRREVQALQENGSITKEQAQAAVAEAQRRAAIEIADYTTAQSGATLSLDVFGKLRGNQVDALKNAAGLLQPTQVGVGSTLYSPVSGVMYQPGADATETVAQGLVDGSISPSQIPAGVNPAVVLQRANQISMATSGSPFNASQSEANYAATKEAIGQNATTYRTLNNAQQTAVQHLDLAMNYAQQLSGIAGLGNIPAKNSVTLAARRAVGDKLVGQYDSALSIARSEIATVLGKGQPTAGFLEEASKILPDNLGPSQLAAKVDTIKKLMADKIKEYSSLSNVPQYGGSNAQGSGSTIINTKIGPVDNSWF